MGVRVPPSAPFDSPFSSPSASRRLAHGEPSITSNVLSERLAGRRLANCESKDRVKRVEGLPTSQRRWHRRQAVHYVYLLRCADNSLYVGETSNLQTREQNHNHGRGGSYTAKRRPVRIVYAERHNSKQEALKRERQLKRWSLQKKELLVLGDIAALSGVSQRARVRTGFTWRTGWPGQQDNGYSASVHA